MPAPDHASTKQSKRETIVSVTSTPTTGYAHDQDWTVLSNRVTATFVNRTAGMKTILTVNTEGLYKAYLASIPYDQQTHVCGHCQEFFDRFGGLVCVGEDGKATSALWDVEGVPAFYAPAVRSLKAKVENRPVEGVFYDGHTVWGTPQNHSKRLKKDFHHFAVPASHLQFKASIGLNEKQMREATDRASARKLEDYKTVLTALEKRYTLPIVEQALTILKSAAVDRSERFVGPVQWLHGLHVARAATSSVRAKQNILWRAIADAPPGYCHPAASMTGNLMEELANGTPFERVKAGFNRKVDGSNFQRSTTAPSEQSLLQAEKIVEELGFTKEHFRRRFARLDECVTVWRSPDAKPAAPEVSSGVFGAVRPREKAAAASPNVALSNQTMTWEKFARTILPTAESIEMLVPAHGHFIGLLGPLDPSTPPLFKWGNNFSGYHYTGGSPPSRWGLKYGWTKVNAIVPYPAMWDAEPKDYLGKGVVLVLDGAMDTTNDNAALFPENMIGPLSDNAGVRRVIEAFSMAGTREGSQEGNVCGYSVSPGSGNVGLRVRSSGTVAQIMIDRWD